MTVLHPVESEHEFWWDHARVADWPVMGKQSVCTIHKVPTQSIFKEKSQTSASSGLDFLKLLMSNIYLCRIFLLKSLNESSVIRLSDKSILSLKYFLRTPALVNHLRMIVSNVHRTCAIFSLLPGWLCGRWDISRWNWVLNRWTLAPPSDALRPNPTARSQAEQRQGKQTR